LEIPPGSIIKKPPERKMVESNANDLNTDYRYARENIYNIIERGQEAIEDLLQDARDSGNARMFEVVGQLIKTVGEQNQNLVNVHKQVKDITQETNAGPNSVTNALFIGSTAELQKMLNDKEK
ncbi:MAG TPA: terminase, partial [Nitrospinaceae bacterium]|nr:terminase [Nitrospinaceae bacterium]